MQRGPPAYVHVADDDAAALVAIEIAMLAATGKRARELQRLVLDGDATELEALAASLRSDAA
jgi:hypothetical protein